jgi:hypothetical protein
MVSPAASHAHDILHLQRTIGNQAVLRLLQAEPNGLEVGPVSEATTRFAHAATFAEEYLSGIRNV